MPLKSINFPGHQGFEFVIIFNQILMGTIGTYIMETEPLVSFNPKGHAVNEVPNRKAVDTGNLKSL